MKFASYVHDGVEGVGLVSADEQSLQPLDAPCGLLALIAANANGAELPPAVGGPMLLSAVRLLAPLPRPRRNLFCVGRNYRAHAQELSASVFKGNSTDVAGWPIVFAKFPDCVVGPHAPIILPGPLSTQIDYEAELAVIVGRGGKNIPRDQAMAHVWGYTIVNDVTARDVQMRHGQWDLGKSFDTFCPMGPWAVTADEFDGRDTRVRCWVNDTLRQDGQTRQMIFDIPSLIETCSRGITLFPGDIIATGTPAGVGMAMTPPTYLRDGDIVRIQIDGIGTLTNPVRSGAEQPLGRPTG